ncbi:MAG TPA: hypothetical protein VHO03_17175 [Ignavibacteriales bacterium]|nr:hypothetical protein [Ignavibacteriales bacterium]
MPLQKILPELVGNLYKYRGENYRVFGYEIKEKTFVLDTNKGLLEIPTVERIEFFENFIKVKPEIKAAETAVVHSGDGQASNSIMGIYKLEMQMVRLADQKEARKARK